MYASSSRSLAREAENYMNSSALKILIADDLAQNTTFLRKCLEDDGHAVHVAASGEESLVLFDRESPDLVLMDVMMPGMGGYEATRRMREMAGDRWLPIIFISALDHSIDMVRGLDVGGDDFICKPVDLTLLKAKIRAMQRIAGMQHKLAEATDELHRYRESAEFEQEIARELMTLMIKAASTEDAGLEMWLEPAARFSGDLLVANHSNAGHLYLLHADSMGHGLAAALPLLPTAQIFRTMSERGFTLSTIVREVNAQLVRQIPRGYFVAATMVCVDRENQVIEVWNGGNPAALLTGEGGNLICRFESMHPPLGILDATRFDSRTQAWQSEQDWTLSLFSDGLVEAEDATGRPFGEAGVLAALLREGATHAGLVAAVKAHLGEGRCAHDDVSLVTLKNVLA